MFCFNNIMLNHILWSMKAGFTCYTKSDPSAQHYSCAWCKNRLVYSGQNLIYNVMSRFTFNRRTNQSSSTRITRVIKCLLWNYVCTEPRTLNVILSVFGVFCSFFVIIKFNLISLSWNVLLSTGFCTHLTVGITRPQPLWCWKSRYWCPAIQWSSH